MPLVQYSVLISIFATMFEEFMWHLLKNEVVGCRCGVQSVALFVLFEQTRAGQWPLPRSFPGSFPLYSTKASRRCCRHGQLTLMSLRSKKATVTWTYVDYEWPNTDWTGNIQLRCSGYSQVLAKMEVLAPLLRFISCISASQRRKPHCHSCFGEAGRPPAYAFEPCKGLYMVLYIYIYI